MNSTVLFSDPKKFLTKADERRIPKKTKNIFLTKVSSFTIDKSALKMRFMFESGLSSAKNSTSLENTTGIPISAFYNGTNLTSLLAV